jgi:hypothetical protein
MDIDEDDEDGKSSIKKSSINFIKRKTNNPIFALLILSNTLKFSLINRYFAINSPKEVFEWLYQI